MIGHAIKFLCRLILTSCSVDIAAIFDPVVRDVEQLVEMQIADARAMGHSVKVLFIGMSFYMGGC